MFERVVLPAPFSPSSACTSPAAASKSTWSLASTPGKRLVIPRMETAGTGEAPVRPAPLRCLSLIGEAGSPMYLALRVADHAPDEPVHRVEVLDRQPLALGHAQLALLVVERAGELVERSRDKLRLDLRDGHLRRLLDPGTVGRQAREAVLDRPVVEAGLPGPVHRGPDAGHVVHAPVVDRRRQPRLRRELARVRVVTRPRDPLLLRVLTCRRRVDVLAQDVGTRGHQALCG